MQRISIAFLAVIIAELFSCTPARRLPATATGKVQVNFIQINDVYEIAPLEGGKTGGMARVAYLSKKIKAENPNSFLVMAGDFLSPSVYNSLKVDGQRVRGRQMVEAMNAAGTDIAIFGNHEFDIAEKTRKVKYPPVSSLAPEKKKPPFATGGRFSVKQLLVYGA